MEETLDLSVLILGNLKSYRTRHKRFPRERERERI